MRRAKALVVLAFLSSALAACIAPALTDAERSDAGIRVRVERALDSHRELDLRSVTWEVHDRTLTVSGSVPTMLDKRTIEQILNALPGIEQVFVNIIVPE